MESKDWSGFGYFSPDYSPGIRNAGITADLNPPRIFDPPVQIRWRIWTPLRRFGPPTKLSF